MNLFAILNQPIDVNHDIEFNNKYVHLSLNNKLYHWHPITRNNVTLLILGKPVIELNEWDEIKDNEKSYISKVLLEKYFKLELDEFCRCLNGAFSIVLLDSNKNSLIVISDKLGMFPIYLTDEGVNNLEMSSHPDLLASNQAETSVDKISAAEFLRSGFINYPNTYYNEIKVLAHASYFIIDFNSTLIEEKKYFTFKPEEIDDFDYLVNMLSKSLVKSIERRTNKHYGSKAVLLSGGADSRSIVSNAIDNTDAITLYNLKNSEILTTEKISERLDIKQHLIKRSFDHYIDILEESVLTNGGMSEITSEHYLTYKENEIFNKYDILLTGCYFDYMFKGLTLNTEKVKLLGKSLPYKVLSDIKDEFYVGVSAISGEYTTQINERMALSISKHNSLIELEATRFIPTHREHDSVMRHSMIREFNWDLLAADNDLIDCFLTIPPKYKINAQVFDKAIQKITSGISDIPHANKKVKIGTHPYLCVLLTFTRFLKNTFVRKNLDKIVGDGSWINFTEYAKRSKLVESTWEGISEQEREIVNSILGYDAWKAEKNCILNQDKGHHLFFRIITFSKWHEMYRKGLLLNNEDIISK